MNDLKYLQFIIIQKNEFNEFIFLMMIIVEVIILLKFRNEFLSIFIESCQMKILSSLMISM